MPIRGLPGHNKILITTPSLGPSTRLHKAAASAPLAGDRIGAWCEDKGDKNLSPSHNSVISRHPMELIGGRFRSKKRVFLLEFGCMPPAGLWKAVYCPNSLRPFTCHLGCGL